MRKFLLASSLIMAACSGAESTGIESVTCPSDSTLTYENFGRALMQDNCTSCHTTRESPALNTVESIRTHTEDILDQAVYTTAMPEDGSMALSEREMLGEWLACGAP